jgi:hypothetical protein
MASADVNAKATHLIAKLTLSLVSLAFCKCRMFAMRLYVLYCQTYSGARIEAQSTIVFAVPGKASLRHHKVGVTIKIALVVFDRTVFMKFRVISFPIVF